VQWPWASYLHLCASVTSPSSIIWYRWKLGVNRHAARYTTYWWPYSVSWCLAYGYKKQRLAPPIGPCGLGRTFFYFS